MPAPCRIETDTIYINAPLSLGAEYLGDLRNMVQWSHLLKPTGVTEAQFGIFRDEYHQSVEVRVTSSSVGDDWLIEQDSFYPQHAFMQRAPALLIPLAHAFGDASVPGFLLHRMTFWRNDMPAQHGKLGIEDFGAEGMNIKRLLEAQAGNMATFALGRSYVPPPNATRTARA